jgi:hypothetical protein
MSWRTCTFALLAACSFPPGADKDARAEVKTAPEQEPPIVAPKFLAAPDGDVAELVRATTAQEAGPLVVYVGAGWCEPCRAFHEAVVAGRYDRELSSVRFLEFDLDRDKARLEAAGYTSRLIPLFALPGPDGRAGGRQIEGGIKGPQAAEHVLRRLVQLLDEVPRPASP